MTTIINGDSPSVTFSDSTTQSTAFTGKAFSASPYTTQLGAGSLVNNTGASNTAIGNSALASNTTASNNTAVGYQAGYSNTASQYNTFVGAKAGYSTTGASNAFFGDESGYSATTGVQNTFIGQAAGYSVTTGSKNTILGQYTGNQGGLDIRTASNYIVLSDGDGNPRMTIDNTGSTFIGKTAGSAIVNGWELNAGGSGGATFTLAGTNEMFVWNNISTAGTAIVQFRSGGVAKGQISWNNTNTTYTTTSDYRLKENIAPMIGALATVAQLNPVTYDWKFGGSSQGFIAHELQAVVPDCVTGEKDGVDEEGNPRYQGIDTSFLVATLTAAIQELNAKVTSLEEQLLNLGVK